ncbi:hypothetical protein [Acidisphaera sp. S103]|uniref:hypothetical protein n=1 Tax=Acidisphaera sp. S103 TaxID=1747223 RepID=UPI00131C2FC4|nr:hypothetical protein [Acidisphaera sp. S103]
MRLEGNQQIGIRPRSERSQPPPDVAEALASFHLSVTRRRHIVTGRLDMFWEAGRWVDLTLGACDDAPTRMREVTGYLVHDGLAVGLVRFREVAVPSFLDDVEFFEHCDGYSGETSAFATALLAGWPVDRVSQYGLLLEFSRMWVALEHARNSAWATSVRALITRRWERRGPTQAALMLLKPFPLEYEHIVGERGLKPQVETRIAAMRRLYARTLGVKPLHGDEWMWRGFRGITPPPARKPRILRFR